MPCRRRRARRRVRVAPRTATEELLAEVWREVLAADAIGVTDSFFDLGGHSLTATRVVSRLGRLFDVEVPVQALFECPTVEALAIRVEALQHAAMSSAPGAAPPLVAMARGSEDALPLSFAQERLWFLHQLVGRNPFYNMPLALHLDGPIDADALEQALRLIQQRHETLRTRFTARDGIPAQVIDADATLRLRREDLSAPAPDTAEPHGTRSRATKRRIPSTWRGTIPCAPGCSG